MSVTIDYSDMSGEAKQRAACMDTLQYLGASTFRHIVKNLEPAVKLEGLTFKEWLICGFRLGIDGYPMRAMWERYVKEPIDEEKGDD